MASVLVYLDHPVVPLAKASRELLTIAATIGEPAVAVGVDALEDGVAQALGEYGVQQIYVPENSDLDKYLIAPKAVFLADVVHQTSPSAVLLDNGFESKEIAGRLGVKLSSGVITDVVSVGEDLTVTKLDLAGSYTVAARVTHGIPVLTVKPNSAEPRTVSKPIVPEQVKVGAVDVSAVSAARITGRQDKKASTRPSLTEARVIVSGGRGTNGDFSAVEALADALGGAVGASRAATDAGWIEHSAQVGQTGQTVSPQLYISAGISGAIQQKAGMQTSKVIVAVNKDADSPIFEIADFGIIGDLFKVLPQATEEIQKRQS